MLGRATFTIDASRTTTNCAAQSRIKAVHRRSRYCCVVFISKAPSVVLAAAKKLFADQGLDAQMPDVARSANVGVGTVYRHFPTKQDLIAELVAERFERLAQKTREALESEDAWEGVSDFIRFSAQIQADDRGLCEVMGSRPDAMDAAARAAGLPKRCVRLRERGQRTGQPARG